MIFLSTFLAPLPKSEPGGRQDGVMGRPFIPLIQVTNSDGEEEEITKEDQLTHDLVMAWEVVVDQYVQREACERIMHEGMVRDELSMPPVVYNLLGEIPRLVACNLLWVEEERTETQRERRRQQVLQQFAERRIREREERENSKKGNKQ